MHDKSGRDADPCASTAESGIWDTQRPNSLDRLDTLRWRAEGSAGENSKGLPRAKGNLSTVSRKPPVISFDVCIRESGRSREFSRREPLVHVQRRDILQAGLEALGENGITGEGNRLRSCTGRSASGAKQKRKLEF